MIYFVCENIPQFFRIALLIITLKKNLILSNNAWAFELFAHWP